MSRRVHGAWIAIGAGMIARLAWALAAPPAVFDDAASYRTLAHAIAAGRGYATAAGPTAYWTPGWAAWMGALYGAGAGDRAVAVASVALGGVTVALVWRLARALGSRDDALWAAAACALAPSLVLLPGVLLSENLALPLVALATLALVRAERTRALADFALFGAAAALATYVRESCAVLGLAGAAIACAKGPLRARAAALGAVSLAMAIALAPWVLRNRATMGAATLTTSAGVNLCIGLGDGATGGYRKLDRAAFPTGPATPEEEVARHRRGLRCAARGLAHHPLELVTLAPGKLSRLLVWDDWIVDDLYARTRLSRGALFTLRALCDVTWWALLAATAVAAWRSARQRRNGTPARDREESSSADERRDGRWPVLAVAGAVVVSVLVGFGGGRFHTPVLPLLAVLASSRATWAWYRRTS